MHTVLDRGLIDVQHPRSTVTTSTHHAAAVLRAVRASLTGDSTVVATIFAPNVDATLPTRATCAAAVAVEFEDRRDAFVDVEVEVVSTETRDTRTWVEWHASVTHVGALIVDDTVFPATGRHGVVRGITVADFVGDRIVGFRQYWDCSGLLHDAAP